MAVPSFHPRSLKITIAEAMQGTNNVMVVSAINFCISDMGKENSPAVPNSRRMTPIIKPLAASLGKPNQLTVRGTKAFSMESKVPVTSSKPRNKAPNANKGAASV